MIFMNYVYHIKNFVILMKSYNKIALIEYAAGDAVNNDEIKHEITKLRCIRTTN
jgi:hypothetical protein